MTGLNKMCSFVRNIGLLPLIAIVSNNEPYFVFGDNPLSLTEMHLMGLNKMCSFAWNIGLCPLVAIISEKLTLLCEGLKAIR